MASKAKIIDVSYAQGVIDWEKVKPHIDGAILRVGYGMDITEQDDKYFKRNADECTRLGIPFGVYIYSYADTVEKAKSEAKHVLRLIKGYKLSYPVYLDLEENNTRTGAVERAEVFGDIIEKAGYLCGIYANLNWWNNYLKGLDRFTKWVAQWAKECTYKGSSLDMWQYSEKGSLPGITGNVDLNHCYRDFQEELAGAQQFDVGDIVNFNGTNHYASANASTGLKVKASKVKITAINKSGKHPYHCRAINDAGAFIGGVYGWVNAADLSAIVAETTAPKPTTPATPVTPAAIKKGDIVSIAKNATYYRGKDIPDWVVAKHWIVAETPVGDRVVINKSVDGKHAINSPVHAKFLTVVKADEPWTPKVGDIVNYNGNKHYVNANAANGSTCKGGLAKITNIYQLGKSKHPYHLVRVAGKGATVYGWCDEGTFTKA